MEAGSPRTLSELLGAFHELLVVVVHQILYLREVYPEASFERRRHYGVAVHRSRYPVLCEWIENLALACMGHIRNGTIARISIVLLTDVGESNTGGTSSHESIASGRPLERFVLDVRDFPVPGTTTDPNGELDVDVSWAQIAAEYRACLVTLTTLAPSFGQLPENVTFTVVMESKTGIALDPQDVWISADKQRFHLDQTPKSVQTRPIRFADAGPISFSFTLEEDKLKGKLPG